MKMPVAMLNELTNSGTYEGRSLNKEILGKYGV